MTESTAYCLPDELMIGDLIVGSSINRQEYVDRAAEEIDSKIGWVYATPIDTTGLPRAQTLLLKIINIKIASARLIMALSVNDEDNSVHAYALRLLKEGTDDLLHIANGDVDLDAPRTPMSDANAGSRTPGVYNIDVESLLDPFYSTTNWGVKSKVEIGKDPRG